ncbi:MAG: HWE histidine kinase domain-containing protein [Phenylobacterium sp.]|nr:HWE histidine kinase domain-containing protein [Phenylobacterium sp.]
MADQSPGTGRDDGPEPELVAALGAALLDPSWQEGLLVCDRAFRIVFCSRSAAALMGLPDPAPVGESLWELQPELQGGLIELRYRSAMQSGDAGEFVVPAHDVDDGWIEVRSLPLPQAMGFLLRDVSERERGERRLREMNTNLRLAHKAAQAASWELRRGRELHWLDVAAARQLLGAPRASPFDAPLPDWSDLVSAEDRPKLDQAMVALADKGEATFEFKVIGRDGVERWLESRGFVTERDPKGGIARVLGITLDVTARHIAEAVLRSEIAEREKAETHLRLLINELNHRVKNTLASVQSIARQTLRHDAAPGALELFEARLQALAWTHDVLTREHWAGASLDEMVRRILSPHEAGEGARFEASGPPVRLSPQMALALAMGLHELATNAVKYGALSAPKGRVRINWHVAAQAGERPELTLRWRELGGPRVRPPTRRGFGSHLIERGLAAELGGGAEMVFAPSGLKCVIRARLD